GPPQPQRTATPKPNPNVKPAATAELPAKSGSGHRVVFDITAQQVWLVNSKNAVVRTYLVSGSRFDQLPTGTFEVFSKSRDAVSWHGTELLEYVVRLCRAENSYIGSHVSPVASATGEEVQTLSQLGTPLSDGCIRQDLEDAVALWEHTPVGTPIVVVRTGFSQPPESPKRWCDAAALSTMACTRRRRPGVCVGRPGCGAAAPLGGCARVGPDQPPGDRRSSPPRGSPR